MKYIIDIHGENGGGYELIGKYEERPQGEWVMAMVPYGKGYWRRAPICNRCACKKPDNIGQIFSNNFCPNCGADMGGKNEQIRRKQ